MPRSPSSAISRRYNQTDFSGVASKVVAACDKATALCLMVTAPQAERVHEGPHGRRAEDPMGGPTLSSAIPLFAQGTTVEGMLFIATAVTAGPQLPDSYQGKPMIAGRVEAVMAETKAPPDTFSGWAADAVNLMAEAAAGSTDKAAVGGGFESITDFQGLSGVYSYSARPRGHPRTDVVVP